MSENDAAPTLSVLMSVWNEQQYLEKSIASVLGQTFGDFEFVIVNDGSSDRSGEIIKSFANRDERIVSIEQQNTGLTRALNLGLARCGGRYVARMDGDDVCLPTRFEEQINFLEEHDHVVALGGQVELIDGEGYVVEERELKTEHDQILADLLGGNGSALSHPTLMCRQHAIKQISGYREQFKTAQDLDLYLRLARHGELANLDSKVLYYRRHSDAVGSRRPLRQCRDVLQILNEAYQFDGRDVPREVTEKWKRGAANSQFNRAVEKLHTGYLREAASIASRGLVATGQMRFARVLASAAKKCLITKKT